MYSDQLELSLDDLRLQSVVWAGRSPRVLTASYKRFILKAHAEKSVSEFISDDNQYDLWLTIKRAPWNYQGAPSLLPLESGGGRHG